MLIAIDKEAMYLRNTFFCLTITMSSDLAQRTKTCLEFERIILYG